jgi:hypothetical protein
VGCVGCVGCVYGGGSLLGHVYDVVNIQHTHTYTHTNDRQEGEQKQQQQQQQQQEQQRGGKALEAGPEMEARDRALWACAAASVIARRASRRAFAEKRRSMTAPDALGACVCVCVLCVCVCFGGGG